MQSADGTDEELETLAASVPLGESDALPPQLIFEEANSMNSRAAGGLDGWDPSALRCLTKEMCVTLSMLYQHIARLGVWPSAACLVRTQLIPKTPDAYKIEDQRPLSILSIWYSLWSRVTLKQLGDTPGRLLHTSLMRFLSGPSCLKLLCMECGMRRTSVRGNCTWPP